MMTVPSIVDERPDGSHRFFPSAAFISFYSQWLPPATLLRVAIEQHKVRRRRYPARHQGKTVLTLSLSFIPVKLA